MPDVRYRPAAVAVVLSLVWPSAGAQQPSLEEVLARTGSYVSTLIPRLANVVMSEAYEQRTYTQSFGATQMVRQPVEWSVRSTVLLVRYPLGDLDWMMFRDVAEVNGKSLGHPPDRLLELFGRPGADAEEQVARISFESARHHIPGGSFAVTNPLLVVSLVQPHYQPRLRFSLGGEERSNGRRSRGLRSSRARGNSSRSSKRSTRTPGPSERWAGRRLPAWIQVRPFRM